MNGFDDIPRWVWKLIRNANFGDGGGGDGGGGDSGGEASGGESGSGGGGGDSSGAGGAAAAEAGTSSEASTAAEAAPAAPTATADALAPSSAPSDPGGILAPAGAGSAFPGMGQAGSTMGTPSTADLAQGAFPLQTTQGGPFGVGGLSGGASPGATPVSTTFANSDTGDIGTPVQAGQGMLADAMSGLGLGQGIGGSALPAGATATVVGTDAGDALSPGSAPPTDPVTSIVNLLGGDNSVKASQGEQISLAGNTPFTLPAPTPLSPTPPPSIGPGPDPVNPPLIGPITTGSAPPATVGDTSGVASLLGTGGTGDALRRGGGGGFEFGQQTGGIELSDGTVVPDALASEFADAPDPLAATQAGMLTPAQTTQINTVAQNLQNEFSSILGPTPLPPDIMQLIQELASEQVLGQQQQPLTQA